MGFISNIRVRIIFGCGFVFCCAVLLLSWLVLRNLPPCPLCDLQDIVLAILSIIFAIAFIHNPKSIGTKIYGGLIFIFSLLGVLLTTHQIWLQSMPPASGQACSLGIRYALQVLPLKDAFFAIMQGAGECVAQPRFLALTLAQWRLIFFIFMGLVAIWLVIKRFNKQNAVNP